MIILFENVKPLRNLTQHNVQKKVNLNTEAQI